MLRTARLRLSSRSAAVTRQLLEEHPAPAAHEWGPGPWLVVDLHTTLPDGQQGRRSYALIAYFVRAGYRVALVANRGFVGNIDRKLKRLLLELPMVAINDLGAFGGGDATLLTDRPRSTLPRGFRRQIVIKTSGPFEPARGQVAFPFTLHPATLHLGMDSDLARFREIPRRWRVFFGGACSKASYDTHWIRREFAMVPRSRVLEILSEELTTLTPASANEVEDFLTRDVTGFVWPPETAAIPPERWLEVVAHAAVFAAAPGVSYPMCHNIIEAMAVGTVPLTEYPEQFDPPLRHRENCLVYSGEDELRSRHPGDRADDARGPRLVGTGVRRVLRHPYRAGGLCSLPRGRPPPDPRPAPQGVRMPPWPDDYEAWISLPPARHHGRDRCSTIPPRSFSTAAILGHESISRPTP